MASTIDADVAPSLPKSLARATTKTLPASKSGATTSAMDEKRVNKRAARRRRRDAHITEAFHVERRNGSRRYQEDRFDVFESPSADVLIAAVYDGHGGAQTSDALMRGKRRDTEPLPPFTRYLFAAYEANDGEFPTGDEAARLFHDYDGSLWQESERRRMQQLLARKDVRSVVDETVLDADDDRERLHAFSHVPYTSDEDAADKAATMTDDDKTLTAELPRIPVTIMQPDRSGSTVALLARDGCRIYLYNVGDSRVVFMDSHGRIVQKLATEDHKPERQAEVARAKAKGGEVTKESGTARTGSVFSDYAYATSRAMGDVALKKDFSQVHEMGDAALDEAARDAGYLPNMRPLDARMAVAQALAPIDFDGVMSSTPDVYVGEFPRAGTYYAVLATDGLWDVTQNSDVAQWVRDTHEYAPDSAYLAAEHLAELAIQHATDKKSEDNTTVLAVRFDVDETALEECSRAEHDDDAPRRSLGTSSDTKRPAMAEKPVDAPSSTMTAQEKEFWQDLLRMLEEDEAVLDSDESSLVEIVESVPEPQGFSDTTRLEDIVVELDAMNR